MALPIVYGSERRIGRFPSFWSAIAVLGIHSVASPAFGQDANAAPLPAGTEATVATQTPASIAVAVAAQPQAQAPAGNSAEGVAQPSTAAGQPGASSPPELESEEVLALPGSPRPPVLGLASEAPNVPAAVGGRAPSFGAPGPGGDQWSFRFGGRIAGFQNFGMGRRPNPAPEGYEGTPWHVPALTAGRGGIWAGAGLTLFMTYGNPTVSANVSYFVNLNGHEYRGHHSPQSGPLAGQAYLAFSPPKLGSLQLQAKVGAFTETYGGVGQWGWGIMGPLLGLKGYGEVISGELPLSRDYRLWFSHGVSAVPALPENIARGDYSGWVEPAMSSFVHHAHLGVNLRNNHGLRLHYARIYGIDERQLLNGTTQVRDGHMDVFLADLRTRQEQFGHFAIAGGLYDVKNGKSINDGLWWGIDWTQGATTQVAKFIGDKNTGTGKYAVLSAQWDLSLARILWHPRNFDGRHPDIRGAIAGLYHATVETDDSSYDSAAGYTLGAELEYVLLSWFGVFLRSYVESRDVRKSGWALDRDLGQLTSSDALRRFETRVVMPGIILRSDWASTDSIQIAYQRRSYNDVSDPNPTAPLDRDVFTLGATASF